MILGTQINIFMILGAVERELQAREKLLT